MPGKPNVVFVLGGPGAGKGTECAKLVQEYGFVHLSAGDLLREERKNGGEQGELIDSYIKEGKIIPVAITIGLIKTAMEKAGADGKDKFLIDGFPRNADNLDGWNKIMDDVCVVHFCLYMECTEEIMQQRILGRDEGRADDNIEAVRKRFKTYVESTMPIIKIFEQRELLKQVDSTGTPEQVHAACQQIFAQFKPTTPPATKNTETETETETATPAITPAPAAPAAAPVTSTSPALLADPKMQIKEASISARNKFEQTIDVDATGQVYGGQLSWFFEESFGYDVNFSVQVKLENKGFENVKIPSRCVTNKGAYITAPGTKCQIVLVWDNAFSMFTSKSIKYSVHLVAPSERAEQERKEQEELERQRAEAEMKRKEEQARREEEERKEQERREEEERKDRERREEQERIEREAREAAELKSKIDKELGDVVDTVATEKQNWSEQAAAVEEKRQEAIKVVIQQFERLKKELGDSEKVWVMGIQDRVKRVQTLVEGVTNDEQKKVYLDQLGEVSVLLSSDLLDTEVTLKDLEM